MSRPTRMRASGSAAWSNSPLVMPRKMSAAAGRRLLGGGEAQVDDLHAVAPVGVEADRGAHQRVELLQLFRRARLVGLRAVRAGGIDAVDQHRDRQLLDDAALAHLALHRLGDLVVDRLLVAPALRARPRAGALVRLRVRQVVGDADRLIAAVAAVVRLVHWSESSGRPDRPGSKLSEFVVTRSKSMSAWTSARTLPGPIERSSISSTERAMRFS